MVVVVVVVLVVVVVVMVVVAAAVAVVVLNPDIRTYHFLLAHPSAAAAHPRPCYGHYSLLTTHYSLLTTHYFTAYNSPARRRPATARGAPRDRVQLHDRLHRRVGTGPAQTRPRFRLRRL